MAVLPRLLTNSVSLSQEPSQSCPQAEHRPTSIASSMPRNSTCLLTIGSDWPVDLELPIPLVSPQCYESSSVNLQLACLVSSSMKYLIHFLASFFTSQASISCSEDVCCLQTATLLGKHSVQAHLPPRETCSLESDRMDSCPRVGSHQLHSLFKPWPPKFPCPHTWLWHCRAVVRIK